MAGPTKTFLFLLLPFLPACARMEESSVEERENGSLIKLFDPGQPLEKQWRHVRFRGATDYNIVTMDGHVAIRAEGRTSASGLFRRIDIDPEKCPWINWSWRVESIQLDADIRVKDRDDVAASLYLFFGDPGGAFNPKIVPTLGYVWTNDKVPVETVVRNPGWSGIVRSIVVESGGEKLGKWLSEKRNILEDFERAFGHRPTDRIHAIVLLTDNDQTAQPVEAYYGGGNVVCTP